MRYLIAIIVGILGCSGLCAQTWNFGVDAGYLYNILSTKEYKASGKNGFQVGALVDYSFSNNLILESGLYFQRKGGEISGDRILGLNVSRIDFPEMDYLRVPIMVGYRIRICSDFSVAAQAGAYWAVGVGGHSFVTGINSFGQPYHARVSTFSEDSAIPYRPCNRSDLGIALCVNLKYRHIGIKVGYDLALTNFTLYGDSKHRTFSIGAEYWLK